MCCCVRKVLCLGILLCCILSVFVEPNVRKGLCVCVCVCFGNRRLLYLCSVVLCVLLCTSSVIGTREVVTQTV